MIDEIGVVIKTEGITAKVAVQRKGTCEGCAVQGVCEPSEGGMEIEALNPIAAKEGQKVRIAIKPQTYLRGTIMVYGFPLVLFIIGVITGKNIGEAYFTQTNSDIVSVIAGFSSLIIGFLIVKAWSRKIETDKKYKPVIEEILE